MTELEDLIAKQRAALEAPKHLDMVVAVGGAKKTVRVSKLWPDEWQRLVRACPPAKGYGPDESIGYNQDLLPRQYPVGGILVDGEAISAEVWASLFSVVDASHKNNLHTAMWQLNVMDTLTELQELGKAEAGRSSTSPANRASRRGASKAGSRQK